MISGFGGGGSAEDPGRPIERTKGDTKTRRTLVLPWQREPNRVWGVEVWAWPRSEHEGTLVELARATPPHGGCIVAGMVEARWVDPVIALKVWRAEVARPFQPIEVKNPNTGESFIRAPASYVGTPFDAQVPEENLWLPRPLPRDQYPDEASVHPFYRPEVWRHMVER